MAAQDLTVIAELLGVAPPWRVADVRLIQGTQTVTVRVEHAVERGGFFARQPPAPRHQMRWDHITLAGLRCQVLLCLRDGERVPAATWTGEATPGFTRALTRQIMDLLLVGATPEQLSILLRLPFADVWRHKFRLDQGQVASATLPSDMAGTAATPTPKPAATTPVGAGAAGARGGARAGRADDLPPIDSRVWLALLMGRLPLEVHALSLRLLLAQQQREANLHGDADLHRKAAQGLYHYFVRNRATLAREVAQLGALAPQAATAAPPAPLLPTPTLAADAGALPRGSAEAAPPLPDASDPLWLALLQGQCELDVRTLGLKLLLAKLRTQIAVIHDDDVRMLKLVELHRYFQRHQALLGHEVRQLHRWTAR